MKTHEKIYGLLLVLFLLLAAPVAAFAQEYVPSVLGPSAVEKGSITGGETALVGVTIQTEDGLIPGGMDIAWAVSDSNALKIEAADEPGAAIVTGMAPAEEVVITAQLLAADGSFTNDISSTVIQVSGSNEDKAQTNGSGETVNITLGPLAVEHGTINVGETSLVVATIRTDDGQLPNGMEIVWKSGNENAVALSGDPNKPGTVVATGLAPAEEVVISAQLFDADGDPTNEISNTVIRIAGSNQIPVWVVVVIIVAAIIIAVLAFNVAKHKHQNQKNKNAM